MLTIVTGEPVCIIIDLCLLALFIILIITVVCILKGDFDDIDFDDDDEKKAKEMLGMATFTSIIDTINNHHMND